MLKKFLAGIAMIAMLITGSNALACRDYYTNSANVDQSMYAVQGVVSGFDASFSLNDSYSNNCGECSWSEKFGVDFGLSFDLLAFQASGMNQSMGVQGTGSACGFQMGGQSLLLKNGGTTLKMNQFGVQAGSTNSFQNGPQ